MLVLQKEGDSDNPQDVHMNRRALPMALVAAAAGTALFSQRAQAQTCPDPCNATDSIIDARINGFSESASAEDNKAAIDATLDALKIGGRGIVQLPSGTFNVCHTIDIPEFVGIRGCGSGATKLVNNNTGNHHALLRLGGCNTGVVKYGTSLTELGIQLTHKDGKAIEVVEMIGAFVSRLYIEGVYTMRGRRCSSDGLAIRTDDQARCGHGAGAADPRRLPR
jgi:hypothetical protein